MEGLRCCVVSRPLHLSTPTMSNTSGASWRYYGPVFTRLLPCSARLTNEITALTSASRPHLSKPANRRRSWGSPRAGGRATQVTQKKKKIERRRKKTWACYGVGVKQTRISTFLYQLNQYLWIENLKYFPR